MKVCYIAVDVAVPHFRGASTHVYEVAKNLTRLGHTVHVISRRLSPNQAGYELLDGINVHRLYRGLVAPLPFSKYNKLDESSEQQEPRSLGKLYTKYLFTIYPRLVGHVAARIIRRYGLDVIVERETSFGAGAVASTLTGKPMVLELIGPRYSKESLARSRKIILYTRSMLQDPVSPEKLFFVSAATDTTSFKPDSAVRRAVREKFGFQNSTVIGYVGTFPKWHGVEELIHSSVSVLQRFPSTKFLMVGPYYGYAKQLVEKLGLSSSFTFTGPVPYSEVPRYINASDIMVAPYNPAKSELRKKYGIGSPIKLFEYMACAKPVITTDIGIITEVVQDGKTSIIVPQGARVGLSEAIVRLMENPRVAAEIGQAGRVLVENQYSWMALAKGIEGVLEECVSKK